MKDYTEVTYRNKPGTEYPEKLVEHLFKNGKKGLLKGYSFTSANKILDLGSGRGDYLKAFCKHGFKVEGFDQCPPEEELKAYEVTLGNLEKALPYKNNTFDIIFSKSVIEHLYYPEKLFKEVYRILKPGGVFITLTPDWYSCQKIFYEDFTHRTNFTLNSIVEIYLINRFQNVNCRLIRQLPCLWNNSWLLPFCKLASLFYNIKTKNKFVKFSKEKMILGIGVK